MDGASALLLVVSGPARARAVGTGLTDHREGVECSPASGGSELSEEEEEVVPSEAAAPGENEG